MSKKSASQLTLVVADDNKKWLNLIGRWFKEFESNAARPETCSLIRCQKLADVEDQVLNTGAPSANTLVLLDLDWQGDKKESLALVTKLRKTSVSGSYRIVVYSESDDPKDMDSAYKAAADGYLFKGKANQKEQFKSLITLWSEQVGGPFWLTNRALA